MKSFFSTPTDGVPNVQVYIPCSMTVSVSWLSFWLDHKAVGKIYKSTKCQYKLSLTLNILRWSSFNEVFDIFSSLNKNICQVPARVALGVTTLLAMSTTQASIQNSLPPVAYTKAIDVWSGVCVVFVFSALLEYALVNYASRLVKRQCIKKIISFSPQIARCCQVLSHNGIMIWLVYLHKFYSNIEVQQAKLFWIV